MAKKKKDPKSNIVCSFKEDDFYEHMDNYITKDIADEAKRYSIIAGVNKNYARHIPSGYDGLKPVARRTLLTLYQERGKFQKVNRISGNCMGMYHPHGSGSISDVISNMGQRWANNIMYIDTQGSFGTQNGQKAAADRYIECKISKFALKCFFEDYKYASLDMKPTYLGDSEEPEYLPVKYPIALVNPQFSSIGYGTSANIAPYNFTEVLEATIKLIKDPKAKVKLIPDFPSGCDVIADEKLAEVDRYHGHGTVTVQSTTEIDYDNNIIIIRSIPLQTSTGEIQKKISEQVLLKKFDEIKDIKDYTNAAQGVCMEIHLKDDANPDKVLDRLLKKGFGLRKTFAVQLKFVEDYKEKDYSPREYLLHWIDFRREVVQSMYNNKYVRLMEELYMLDIKIFVFRKDNLEKTVKIIKKSDSLDDSIQKLMKAYSEIKMTTLQAKTICSMRMSDFNKQAYAGFLERREVLVKEIAETESIILSGNKIDEIILKELEEGIKLFGGPRRSKIIYAKDAQKKIEARPMILAISKDGYIKKLDKKLYSTIGSLGETSSQEVVVIGITNNKSIIVFDSRGKATKVPVAGIPEATPEDNGIQASRFFNVNGRVVSIMEEFEDDDDVYVTFFTKNGFSKKTKCSEFISIRDSKTAMAMDDSDELVSVILTYEDGDKLDDIIIYTDDGDGVRINLKEIKCQGSNTRGRRMINLHEDEVVAGVDRVRGSKRYLFYITTSGKVKVTESKLFPTMERREESLPLLTLSKTEKLVGIASVNKNDRILVYRKIGEPEEIKVADIKPSLRVAKAEKMVKISKGDIVVGFKVLSNK